MEVKPSRKITDLFGIPADNGYLGAMIENQFHHYILNNKLGQIDRFQVDKKLAGISGLSEAQCVTYSQFLQSIKGEL